MGIMWQMQPMAEDKARAEVEKSVQMQWCWQAMPLAIEDRQGLHWVAMNDVEVTINQGK